MVDALGVIAVAAFAKVDASTSSGGPSMLNIEYRLVRLASASSSASLIDGQSAIISDIKCAWLQP